MSSAIQVDAEGLPVNPEDFPRFLKELPYLPPGERFLILEAAMARLDMEPVTERLVQQRRQLQELEDMEARALASPKAFAECQALIARVAKK